MEHDPHDDTSRRQRPRRGRLHRPRGFHGTWPGFCIEMIDAAFMDSDYRHRVVAGPTDAAGLTEEWIELDAPTELYANPRGDHLLAVTVRVENGEVRILANDAFAAGSLRHPQRPSDRPDGLQQLLWLAHPRSGLSVELVADSTGRIDAILGLDGVRAFNRSDVPRFVGSFASAIDLVEQMIRDTGLRQDHGGI
jgi:hypothetical protein